MKDRIALVTGGMGDIGTAICKELASNGAKIIAADRMDKKKSKQWQSEQKKQGYDFDVVCMDVAQYESCVEVAKEVEKNIGLVDIIVNGAGTINDSTFHKMTVEQWMEVVHTDLDSMFNVTRPFINGMISRNYGRIINISSVNAQKGQFGQTNYASAKSGIYGFTKSLAQEVARRGITVNAVSPGYVESHMVMSIEESIREKIAATIPVGRFAKPSEIAWAVCFLASERSGFITGSNLAINGGLHMY